MKKKNCWIDVIHRLYYKRKNDKDLNSEYGDLKVFTNGKQLDDKFFKKLELST